MKRYWLVEQGINEDRAALIDNGDIIAVRIRRHDSGPFVGAVLSGRLQLGGAPYLLSDDGQHIAIDGPLGGLSDGAQSCVRIVREHLGESSGDHRRVKPPRGQLVAPDTARAAPDFIAALNDDVLGGGCPVQMHIIAPPPTQDQLKASGWADIMEQAQSGVVPFDGGRLIISPTPGMTVVDVDSSMASGIGRTALAKAAAIQAAKAIMRFDIGGAVAIDFPAIELRTDRQAVAATFEAAMHGPFERTAINGFGLMHIVRRRQRPSVIEQIQLAPVYSALSALLRVAQRSSDLPKCALYIDNKGANMLARNPHWLDILHNRTGIKPPIYADADDIRDYRLEPLRHAD